MPFGFHPAYLLILFSMVAIPFLLLAGLAYAIAFMARRGWDAGVRKERPGSELEPDRDTPVRPDS